MDYGVPGGDQRTNMFSFRMSGGRDLKIKWSVVHGDRRWFAFAQRPAFDGTLELENRGRAYHFGTDGSVTELLTSRSKGPFYGLALAPNCKPSNTVELP